MTRITTAADAGGPGGRMGNGQSIFGYFDGAQQTKPAFDPGLEAPCPHCLRPVGGGDIKSISLMLPGSDRSYFYRVHKDCHEDASDADIQAVESSIIDTDALRVRRSDASQV